LEVNSIALFSYKTPYKPEPSEHIMNFLGVRKLHYVFDVIQLNRLDWNDFLNHPNPVASALMAKMKIARKDRVKVKLACLKMLTGLELNEAQKRLLSGFIDIYLNLNERESETFRVALAKEPPPKQEQIMELTTSWKIEGKREVLLEQLNFRFGELKPKMQKQILGLSEQTTEKLARAIFGFTNINDLIKWLAQSENQ
jgi:Domain of unknown function (DUF4351)